MWLLTHKPCWYLSFSNHVCVCVRVFRVELAYCLTFPFIDKIKPTQQDPLSPCLILSCFISIHPFPISVFNPGVHSFILKSVLTLVLPFYLLPNPLDLVPCKDPFFSLFSHLLAPPLLLSDLRYWFFWAGKCPLCPRFPHVSPLSLSLTFIVKLLRSSSPLLSLEVNWLILKIIMHVYSKTQKILNV